jgi:hypothetical protein
VDLQHAVDTAGLLGDKAGSRGKGLSCVLALVHAKSLIAAGDGCGASTPP